MKSWNRTDWLILILFTGLVALFFWRILTPDAANRQSFPPGDFYDQFWAFTTFDVRELGAGRLPLWSPFTFAGSPFWADVQAAVLYPLSLLTLLLSAPWGFSAYALSLEAILHFWLAAFFMGTAAIGCFFVIDKGDEDDDDDDLDDTNWGEYTIDALGVSEDDVNLMEMSDDGSTLSIPTSLAISGNIKVGTVLVGGSAEKSLLYRVTSLGRRGGFRLSRPPDEISLAEIVAAVDESCDESRCMLSEPVCGGPRDCLLGTLVQSLNQQVRQFLANSTLAELIDNVGLPILTVQ